MTFFISYFALFSYHTTRFDVLLKFIQRGKFLSSRSFSMGMLKLLKFFTDFEFGTFSKPLG